jgi:hypothetical protein
MKSESSPKTSLRSAEISLRDDGIVYVKVRQGVVQTMEDATSNMDTALALRGDKKRPLMVDLRVAEPLTNEIRHHYSGTKIVDWYVAMAIVVSATPFGRMVGNVYMMLARPYVPIRLFESVEDAAAWLHECAGT